MSTLKRHSKHMKPRNGDAGAPEDSFIYWRRMATLERLPIRVCEHGDAGAPDDSSAGPQHVTDIFEHGDAGAPEDSYAGAELIN